MKNKLYILLLISILSFNKSALSQTDSIKISGQIDTSIINTYSTQELIIKIRQTSNRYSQGELLNAVITHAGSFGIKFKPESEFVYLSFELLYKGTNKARRGVVSNINEDYRPWFQDQNEVYLFEKGDDINFRLGKNGYILFNGKGSEKLNCQYQMNVIEPLSPAYMERAISYDNDGEMLKKLVLQDSLLNLGIKMRLTILKTYKEKLNDTAYNLLYLDAIGSATYLPLHYLFLNCYTYPKETMIKLLQEYYNDYLKKNQLPNIESSYMAKSAYYADMLFEKEFNYFRLYSKKKSYAEGDSFKQIYEHLKLHYSGELRDKLLYICFEKLNQHYSTESLQFVTDAQKTIKDQTYKKLLKKFQEKEELVYPFDLEDKKGKLHKLSNFKDKVLIIDFWFTGCHACAELNKAMSPVFAKFKNNKHVQFISICVDFDKERWLSSLLTNQYTNNDELNLYTNGKGLQYPMIQFHNLISFPRQLIVGKKGEIITSNPPIVSSTPSGTIINSTTNSEDAIYNINKFIKIIDNCLNDNKQHL